MLGFSNAWAGVKVRFAPAFFIFESDFGIIFLYYLAGIDHCL